MQKILIITYYWPPSGGAGVQRWLKFAKYLPQFGVQPVVLTVDPAFASYPQTDESLLYEVAPGTEVHRTKSFELYRLYSSFSKKKEIPYGGFANESRPSLFQKISRFARGNFLLPDPRRGWNKYAYRKALELISAHSIETVITSGPPHSTHLIGKKLQKKTGVRWVADLRDPWTDIYYHRQLYQTALARSIDRRMERNTLEKADRLMVVSNGLLQLFSRKTTVDLRCKTSILPNGFDEDDFTSVSSGQEKKFTITYTGTISGAYNISGLIAALKKLGGPLLRKIKIRFVGKVPTEISDRIKHELPELEIELTGYVDHLQSVGYLFRSSLLLLVIPEVENNEGILTGKFFEYLASRKPILAIGPVKGDLAAIIGETNSGKIFDYADETGIGNFISAVLLSEWKNENKNIAAYSRKGLAEQLSKILIPAEK